MTLRNIGLCLHHILSKTSLNRKTHTAESIHISKYLRRFSSRLKHVADQKKNSIWIFLWPLRVRIPFIIFKQSQKSSSLMRYKWTYYPLWTRTKIKLQRKLPEFHCQEIYQLLSLWLWTDFLYEKSGLSIARVNRFYFRNYGRIAFYKYNSFL